MASRTAQRLKFLKGKAFKYHRLLSVIGACLLLLHPIPMALAHRTTGMNVASIFVPGLAPKQPLWIALGIIAAYILIVVTISSLRLKQIKRGTWRVLHYGTYLVFVLGLVHGLFISAEFRGGEQRKEIAAERLESERAPAGEPREERGAEKDRDKDAKDASSGERKDEGETFDFKEPEKIILLVMAGIVLLFPVWRIVVAKRNRAAKATDTIVPLLLLLCLAPAVRAQGGPASSIQNMPQDKQTPPARAQENKKDVPASRVQEKRLPSLTGVYITTFNLSAIGSALPSLNHKLNLDYALPRGRQIDFRLEYYTEGSYNENPPGRLLRNINEPKFEGQLTYTAPITSRFSLSAAILNHQNFRFSDPYWWAILTATYIAPLRKNLTLTLNASGEKNLSGARPFVDFSGTLDYNFIRDWTLEANLHEYENVGATDRVPTHKQEYEFALIRQLPRRQFIAVSFFRHVQFEAINDQFSFFKIKYGFNF